MEISKKVQIIVYVEMALIVLCLIAACVMMGFKGSILDKAVDSSEYYEREDLREVYRANLDQGVAFIFVWILLSALMSAILFFGYRRNDDTKLDAWLIVHGMILVLMGFGLIHAISHYSSALALKKNVQTILYVVYRVWSLYVMNQYVAELRSPDRNGRGPQEETDSKAD